MDEEQSHKKAVSLRTYIWRFFSSIRMALILILILVGLTLIGTFVIQVPADYLTAPGDYEYWLQNIAQPQTGFWYPVLRFMSLFNVFHSFWFLGTGVLLIISIAVCSLNRLKQLKVNISLGPVEQADGFYQVENQPLGLSGIGVTGDSEASLAAVFKKRGYAVATKNSSGNLYLAADKNRWSPLGTYLIHLSLILFIIGFLVTSYSGFRDTSFAVPEGATRDIGHNTGLSVRLNSFSDTYWDNGSPKEYRSEVTVLKNNQPVTGGTIQVNHPLSYEGVRIYQSFFGPAAQIRISTADGKELYTGNIALTEILANHPYQRPSGGFRLIQEGYVIYIVGRATNMNDEALAEGQVGLEIYKTASTTPLASTKLDKGVPYTDENIQVTYMGDAKFSGFQISRDPGNNFIWAASGMFLIGLVAVFYFPRRRMWALVRNEPGKGQLLWLRTDSTRRSGAAAELKSIAVDLKRELGRRPDSNR